MAPKQKSPEGSLALHSLDRNLHSSDIVASSAAKEQREKGTRYDNAEQKIGAFIARLDAVKGNEQLETRLIDRFEHELVIKTEDIPEAYWKQQLKLARDTGFGLLPLGPREKKFYAEQLQSAQLTGIESWTNYLADNKDKYPTWFNVYALDGMSSLGTFNKEEGRYNRRSKSSVAPFPRLDEASLEQTFEAVNAVHNKKESIGSIDPLITGGSFNKIYSHFLLENKAIIPTPEKAEDVEGEWRRYDELDIEEIIDASQGTPWCIAGGNWAEEYTKNGGAFYFFHLKDPKEGVVSPTAAASIRMEGGQVSEISGLKGGVMQIVEDSLLPAVFEKAKELVGGEGYLMAYEDNQKLIEMDKKFQAGEKFSKEELVVLYELDHQLYSLRGNDDDPRPNEFRKQFSELKDDLIEAGLFDAYVDQLGKSSLILNADTLLDSGVPQEKIIAKMDTDDIVANLDFLLTTKLDHSLFLQKLPRFIRYAHRKKLIDAGVDEAYIVRELTDEDLSQADSHWMATHMAMRTGGNHEELRPYFANMNDIHKGTLATISYEAKRQSREEEFLYDDEWGFPEE